MHPRLWLPVLLFATGLAVLVTAIATGDAEMSLIVVFPLISGSGGLFFLGTALIVISFLVGFALLTMGQIEIARYGQGGSGTDDAPREGSRYGGVMLIGPIPIAFGSSMRMALAMLVAGIVIAMVVLGLLVIAAG